MQPKGKGRDSAGVKGSNRDVQVLITRLKITLSYKPSQRVEHLQNIIVNISNKLAEAVRIIQNWVVLTQLQTELK